MIHSFSYKITFAFRLAVFVACLAGCAQETGVIIEVSQEGLGREPDTLRFFVGVTLDDLAIAIPGCGTALRFVQEDLGADAQVDIAGRDLIADPYRWLLKPGADLAVGDELAVAVVALQGADIVGLGAVANPVSFMEDKVLQWPLVLKEPGLGQAVLTGSGCMCAGGALAIVPTTDLDCDGDLAEVDCNDNSATVGPTKTEICANQIDDNCNDVIDEQVDADRDGVFNCEDCNDTNPDVYPGAPEICDGFDNNCNDADGRYPEHVDCYAQDSGQCYPGTRQCKDDDPLAGGWVGECTPVSLDPAYEVPDATCSAFDSCVADLPYEDALRCAKDASFVKTACELALYDSGQGEYLPCPGEVALPQVPATVCTWTLTGGLDQAHYRAVLRADNGNVVEGAVVESCVAGLAVLKAFDLPPELPRPDAFYVWRETDTNDPLSLELRVTPRVVESPDLCPPEGFVCTFALAAGFARE